MIIYGTGSRRISQESTICKCTNCEGSEHLFEIHQKYASVFWIPVFPLGKKCYSVCTNCKKITEYNSMSPDQRESANRIKANAPMALWSFAGVGLIVLIIAIVSFLNMQERKTEANFILEPQLFDVLVFKSKFDNKEDVTLDDGQTISVNEGYFYGMIIDTLADSVDIVFSTHSWYGSVPTESIYIDEFESEEDTWIDSVYYTYSKSELIELHKEKNIIDVFR